jgi:hypothetical protein
LFNLIFIAVLLVGTFYTFETGKLIHMSNFFTNFRQPLPGLLGLRRHRPTNQTPTRPSLDFTIPGMLATAVCLTATAAPVVLEWVQTGSGTASYTTANGVQTVSSDGAANDGRIILADSRLLSVQATAEFEHLPLEILPQVFLILPDRKTARTWLATHRR